MGGMQAAFTSARCSFDLFSSPYPPPQVIGPRGAKKIYVTSTAPLHDHTSLMACGSSGGQWITPLLIFQGERPLNKLFEGFPEANIAMSESGYMDGPTFAGWADTFIKESKASPTRPVLLIVDQHSSHLWLPALTALREANVRVVALHPHTTDWLCALDTSCFASFKKELYRLVNIARTDGKAIHRGTLSYYIKGAYSKMASVTLDTLTQKRMGCCVSGLRSTGIEPFNRQAIPDAAFIPGEAIQAALSKAKSPEAEAADAAKPAALLLSPQERLEIVKSLTSVIPAGLEAALSKKRKGRERLKSELLTGNEYLKRRIDADEAKEAEEAAVAGRAAERAAAKVAKAAAKQAAAKEREAAKAAKAAAKASAPKPPAPAKQAPKAAPKGKASPQPPAASVPGPKGYGARPLPKRYRKE